MNKWSLIAGVAAVSIFLGFAVFCATGNPIQGLQTAGMTFGIIAAGLALLFVMALVFEENTK